MLRNVLAELRQPYCGEIGNKSHRQGLSRKHKYGKQRVNSSSNVKRLYNQNLSVRE